MRLALHVSLYKMVGAILLSKTYVFNFYIGNKRKIRVAPIFDIEYSCFIFYYSTHEDCRDCNSDSAFHLPYDILGSPSYNVLCGNEDR